MPSNPAPPPSTQDNVSQMNQQQQPQQQEKQSSNDNSFMQSNNQSMDMNNMQMTKPSSNMNMSNRLPSLSSVSAINNMTNQNMMMNQGNNQPLRMPPMFGQNQMMGQGYGMNPGMHNMMGQNNVFQGGRFMPPNMNMMQRMNPYQNNMQMMQMPGMQNQMPFQTPMQRPGMMYGGMQGYNQGMMNYPMGNSMMANNPYNRMMMNNNQFQMMNQNPGMNPMMRNMGINQQVIQNNQANQESGLDNNNQYVPGILEEHSINALTNADYKYTDANDLLPDDYGEEAKGESVDPGPYNLEWLLDEGETERDFQNSTFFTPEELNLIVTTKSIQYEQLYLVKWKNLSFREATWEPLSLIQQYDELIEAFERRNKKLDNEGRDKLSKDREINKKIVEHLGISEKKHKNNTEEEETDNHLKLFKYRLSLFAKKTPFELLKKEKGKQPCFKKGQRLKSYQINGTNWLIKAWHDNRNVILADEMGLGKTVQTISFINYLFTQEKIQGPFCVVAPLTTLAHWQKVIDEWTDMNCVLYYDSDGFEGRNAIRLYEWFYTDITKEGYPTHKYKIFKFNILLTSFEVFCSDLYSAFLEVPFRAIVIDEAHRLKNKQSKTLTLLKEHP